MLDATRPGPAPPTLRPRVFRPRRRIVGVGVGVLVGVAGLGFAATAFVTPGAHAALAGSAFVKPGAAPALALRDVTASVGLGGLVAATWSGNRVDYDRDGDLDLFLGFHDKGGALYRNDGGLLTRVATTAWSSKIGGVAQDRHDCAWADVDGDGRPDAYCTKGRTLHNWVKTADRDNELWLQIRPGVFVDRGTEWGVGDPYGRGRSPALFDANGDGRPDLFIGNELPRAEDPDHGVGGENKFFLNTGSGFVRAPGAGLDGFIGASCAFPADLNRDGRADLLVCGSSRPRLYLQRVDGTFAESGIAAGLGNRRWIDVRFGDLNGDGYFDIAFVRATSLSYQVSDGPGHFGPARDVAVLTSGRALALADVNGDGRLDAFAVQDNSSADMLSAGIIGGLAPGRPVARPGGAGTDVVAIDLEGDGHAELVVFNGLDPLAPGPLEVFHSVP